MTVSVSNSKPFCVYQHSAGGVVFYVGSGNSSRPFETYGRTERWKEHVEKAGGYEVSVVAWFESAREARSHESELITKIKPCVNVAGLRIGMSGLTTIRVPEELHERITSLGGKRGRTKWILDACRMRLDGTGEPLGGDESPKLVSEGSIPSSPAKPVIMQALRDICAGKVPTTHPEFRRDIWGDRIVQEIDLGMDQVPGQVAEVKTPFGTFIADERVKPGEIRLGFHDGPLLIENMEIPVCGKTWWEDGEHYECLMDSGHREQKHGMRGMVRRIEE